MTLDADLLERHITGRTPFANFILDTTFTLFRREKWYQAHRSHFYQRMTDLGTTLHPGRTCGADRVDGFRGRRDRLRRILVLGF